MTFRTAAAILFTFIPALVFGLDRQWFGVDDNTPKQLKAGEPACEQLRTEGIESQWIEFGLTSHGWKDYDWTVTMRGNGHTVTVRVFPGDHNTYYNNERISVAVSVDGGTPERFSVPRTEESDPSTNFLRINVMPDGTEILGGAGTLALATRLPFYGYFSEACITSARNATLRRTVNGYTLAPKLQKTPYTTAETVAKATASSKYAIAGVWRQFDTEFDDEYAVPSGTYTIGIVPEHDGSFSIIYLSDKQENSLLNQPNYSHSYDQNGSSYTKSAATSAEAGRLWQPGMVKGRMTATSIAGVYDLLWIDADGNPVGHGENAYLEDQTLNILFPLDHLKIRFVRR